MSRGAIPPWWTWPLWPLVGHGYERLAALALFAAALAIGVGLMWPRLRGTAGAALLATPAAALGLCLVPRCRASEAQVGAIFAAALVAAALGAALERRRLPRTAIRAVLGAAGLLAIVIAWLGAGAYLIVLGMSCH